MNTPDVVPARVRVKDPARLEWHEVSKVAHYYLSVNAMTRPMQVWEDEAPYDKGDQ